MAEGLGRTVLARNRYARCWGLGDRKSASASTPALVLTENCPEINAYIAPFTTSPSDTIPAVMRLQSRLALSPPDFEGNAPNYEVSLGHVLPPSLDEADAGEAAGTSQLLPISWQRMNHDLELMDPELNPDIIVLVDAPQLAAQTGKLVKAIQTLKHRFPGALLWTPGIGGPDNVAVLTWFGVDLFDLSRSHQAVASGALLTQYGPRYPNENLGEDCSIESQIKHWELALNETRYALCDGDLRQLVDRQSLNSPKLVEHLRRHDFLVADAKGVLATHVDSRTVFNCHSSASQTDPIVADWERFMCEEYSSPQGLDKVLVLLPCSARKPYKLSKSHGNFIRAIGTTACHEVMITSPLGIVPRDLEEIWPAAHYDVPVTGDWSGDEVNRINRMFTAFIARNSYEVIINHSGMTLPDVGIEVIDTRQGKSAGNREALDALSAAVKDAVERTGAPRRRNETMLLDTYRSVSRKQMRTDTWLDGCKIRGKPPRWKIMQEKEQLALWSIDRCGFSLSKAVVGKLADNNSLPIVTLKDDVSLKGDIFGHIVESFDEEIRKGQDILLMQNGAPKGIARALAPAWEWNGSPGKLAKTHQRL